MNNFGLRSSSPGRGLVPRILLLGVLFVVVPWITGLYTNYLWFHSVHYEEAFWTVTKSRIALGAVVMSVTFAALFLNARVATLQSSVHVPNFVREWMVPAIFLVAGFSGLVASREWNIWLQFVHSVDFHRRDPIFGNDIAFYVFRLPFWEALRTSLMWLLAGCWLIAIPLNAVRGGVAASNRFVRIDTRARWQLGVLAVLTFLTLTLHVWIKTFFVLYSQRGPVAGASYADVHAQLPALRIQLLVASIGAVLAAFSFLREKWMFLLIAMGAYAAIEILGVRVYTEAIHGFDVTPNEAAKEAVYISHNIDASRFAYGLAHVQERELRADTHLTLQDIHHNQATIDNVRVWDRGPLLDTFAQIQEIRTYYEFASVHNDRYRIQGALRQTMLSLRELATDSLPNRTWINERLTFTHGYGLTLGPVNQATEEGLPVLYIRDIPPTSSIPNLTVRQPAIYFGELTDSYVVVNTRNREFDYPAGENNVFTQYKGSDGVSLQSVFARLAFAMRLGSMKLLLSDDIHDQSRILLHRNVRARASKIAPFLVFDSDPYMVIRNDGTLVWIMDAYTTTERYPYSEPVQGNLNYIRNSVKVTIDAYDGEITLYAADAHDPILRTWSRVFRHMFLPMSKMPADIREHLRYPEDLFRIQTRVFATYHMKGPNQIYNREDQWEVPVLKHDESMRPMDPYYTIMRLPGEEQAEFIQMLPFTPKRKDNLAAWMVARMDEPHRGELVVYRFPKDRLVFGPQQIMNRINQDPEISRLISLWDQRGSQAILGTLVVVPIEESLIYVCPLYLRSSGGKIPELKRIVVVYGNQIAMRETLSEAVLAVFGDEMSETNDRTAQPNPSAPLETSLAENTNQKDLNKLAKELFDSAVEAQREGDWGRYGEQLKRLGEVLEQAASGKNTGPGPNAGP